MKIFYIITFDCAIILQLDILVIIILQNMNTNINYTHNT